MTTATMTQVTVEVIGRQKTGQYGPYHPVLFKLPDGSERWKSYKPGVPELRWLQKGQTYPAVLKGDELTLVEPDKSASVSARLANGSSANAAIASPRPSPRPSTAPSPSPSPPRQPPDRKAEMEQYALKMAGLYSACYASVSVKLPPDVSEETLREATSAVFIACEKKFKLTD